MTVAQFGEHIGEHLELLRPRHTTAKLRLIAAIDLVPVESILGFFVVEKAVVLVDDLPKCLEIAHRRVVELLFLDTRSERDAK